jgi:hypothetical protein
MFYYDKSVVLPCTIFSLAGFAYVLDDYVLPILNHILHKKISNSESIIALGFVRNDLNILKLNILLFIISSALLISLLTSTNYPIYQVLVLITYIAMNALLALSIMFSFLNDLNDRPMKFKTLSHIGYLDDAKGRIIRKEVGLLYFFITVCVLIYLVNIFMTLYLAGTLAFKHIIILLIGSLIPIIICGIVSWLYYRSMIFKK